MIVKFVAGGAALTHVDSEKGVPKMSAIDLVMNEVQSRYGLSDAKASSLLSGLLSFIAQQSGGVSGFIDRFKNAGLGDVVSSWFSGSTRNLTTDQVASVLGSSTVNTMASKVGISAATASSAIALMLPKIMQSIAPSGVIPVRLPSELMALIGGPTAAVATGTRQAMYAAEQVAERSGVKRYLWPLLALLAVALLVWMWGRSGSARQTTFNVEEQVRLATQKATAALAALKPGFTAQDLAGAMNFDVINFASGSAMIPVDNTEFLNKAASAIRSAPAGTVIEVGGNTDNTGDAAKNLQLSQQRAEAVRDYLIGQGASPAMLVAKGYGDSKPIASNETEEGKFRNRRIEFTVVQ
jgi:outer membrane protein OmpA-like peptidoglycan-associated protein/uncharacterized protein YidB (DUF937 family)